MPKLLPCPFCGAEPKMHSVDLGQLSAWWHYYVSCPNRCCCQPQYHETKEGAAKIWNTRAPVKVETNIYDQEELHYGCTVQILINSVTGDQSIGWWPEDKPPAVV